MFGPERNLEPENWIRFHNSSFYCFSKATSFPLTWGGTAPPARGEAPDLVVFVQGDVLFFLFPVTSDKHFPAVIQTGNRQSAHIQTQTGETKDEKMEEEEVANLSNRRKINATMLPVKNALHSLPSETRRAKIVPLIRDAARAYVTFDMQRSSTFD